MTFATGDATASAAMYSTGSRDLLDAYSDHALQRIWKAQNFSYWMTSILHTRADTSEFRSRHGSAYLAEAYTGWPNS